MCCIFTVLLGLGPRFAIIVWWLLQADRFSAAFNSFIWPVLGVILLPWTTLMYLVVWSPETGISGIQWFFIGAAVLVDIVLHGGGGFANRKRLSRTYR